jgi:curved DNA-binding protein CbpA
MPNKLHSHYENLKVARDASPEAIRAAYRTLTRRHHPDRNPDNADAERVMAVINVAYSVLSDPAARREHDRWIAEAEAPALRAVRPRTTLHAPNAHYQNGAAEPDGLAKQRARQAALDRRVRRAVVHVRRHRIAYGAAAAGAIGLLIFGGAMLFAPGIALPIATMPAAQAAAGYARAPVAPNGQPWPARSGYVEGYEQKNRGGLSEVTIDNTPNDADMFVKLVSLDGPSAVPVRTFFVAARGRFTLADLRIGTYDLRYRNLASGALARSPAFILEEVRTTGSPRNATTLRLHRAGDGGMQTYSMGEGEF